MFTLKQERSIAAFAACCILSLAAPAHAATDAQYRSQYGSPAEGGRYDREIVVTPDVRWIDVVSGQVVRFVIADTAGPSATFTWYFDTFGGRVADLSRLAPAGMEQRPVKIYIAIDSRYGGA